MAKKSSGSDNSKVYAVMSLAAALGSAAIAKKGMNASWKVATGKQPPQNPADPDVDVWEALTWAAFSGVVVGVVRMLASRRAAGYYVKSTGHLPGQLKADNQEA